jgi:hypothetical protein
MGFTIDTVARLYSITIQIQLIITNNTPATKILPFVYEKLEKQTTSRAPNVTPTKAIAPSIFSPMIRDISSPYPHPHVTTRARSIPYRFPPTPAYNGRRRDIEVGVPCVNGSRHPRPAEQGARRHTRYPPSGRRGRTAHLLRRWTHRGPTPLRCRPS